MIWKSGISYSIKLFFSSLLTESDTVYSTRNFVCFWIFYVSLSPFFRPLFIISYFPFRKSALNFLHCTLNLFCNELCLPCYSLCDSEGEKIYIFSSAETPFLPFIPFCTEKKSTLYFPFQFYSFTHEYKNPMWSTMRVSGKLLCTSYV